MTTRQKGNEWQLIDSKVVFDTYTKIEERTYKMPDGSTQKYYIKVNRPAAAVLAVTEDQKVVLVEQFRPGPGKLLLELPGGYLEAGEDPLAGAARELKEETGYEGELEFVTNCYEEANSDMVHLCFVARNCRRVSGQSLDDDEYARVKLVSLADFLKIVRSGEMTDVELAFLGLDRLGLL